MSEFSIIAVKAQNGLRLYRELFTILMGLVCTHSNTHTTTKNNYENNFTYTTTNICENSIAY